MEYKIGMTVNGKVTGLQPYGAFVSLDKETQGLIHVSECKHGYVKSIREHLEVGDEVEVIILDIDEYTNKISLSLRALEEPQKVHFHPRKKKHRKDKYKKPGFRTIATAMPKWIEEAKEDEKKRLG